MGPDDYLAMMAGWAAEDERRNELAERELYLLRELVKKVHNATVSSKAKQIADASRILPLALDTQLRAARAERSRRLAEKSDALFARARERGVLAENGNHSTDGD